VSKATALVQQRGAVDMHPLTAAACRCYLFMGLARSAQRTASSTRAQNADTSMRVATNAFGGRLST
jgi:hypothetical protein